MTAPARFIMLVTGIVVAAATLMAPRRDEWLAVMWDQDKQAQIISLLEPQLARGEDDPALLATLGRAYAEIGNYRRAAELLERYTALRPDDSVGVRAPGRSLQEHWRRTKAHRDADTFYCDHTETVTRCGVGNLVSRGATDRCGVRPVVAI